MKCHTVPFSSLGATTSTRASSLEVKRCHFFCDGGWQLGLKQGQEGSRVPGSALRNRACAESFVPSAANPWSLALLANKTRPHSQTLKTGTAQPLHYSPASLAALPKIRHGYRRGKRPVSVRTTQPGNEARASLGNDDGEEEEDGADARLQEVSSGVFTDCDAGPSTVEEFMDSSQGGAMAAAVSKSGGVAGSNGGTNEDFFVIQGSKDSKVGVDYLGESTKGDMNFRTRQSGEEAVEKEKAQIIGSRPIEEVAREQMESAERLLEELNVPPYFPHGLASRGIFCSRTLNLRSITTIGYDMDYTLIHYNVNAWEGRAYEYGMSNLRAKGYPVDGLRFDPELVIRGLIMDKENGNLVKADRFGYVKRALHGSRMLDNRAISDLYGRELVDLRNEGRWEFLNTLFSVSEAVMFMQMVDRLDDGLIPPELGPVNYQELYKVVAKALFRAHVEGQLKAEIINEPEKFVELDPELPLALLDQKEAGKRLLLITNSDYHYTSKMMQHAFDRFLPEGMKWRDLFHMVIVSARKPEFFQKSHPLYEIVTEDGLMRPCFQASPGGLYCGGSAQMVEKALGFHGDETMYVGDHIYTDVSQSKVHLRWRTCLVLREIEQEVEALAIGSEFRRELLALMTQKEVVGDVFNQLRLTLQRRTAGRLNPSTKLGRAEVTEHMQKLLVLMERLDEKIAAMLLADGEYFNKRWGYLSRAGINDKSHLTRQIEKYADIYTSRVSNFLRYTPFMYFRSHSQSLAHDKSAAWPEGSLPEQRMGGEASAKPANGATNTVANGTARSNLTEASLPPLATQAGSP